MIDPKIYEMFRDIGRDLYAGGLISSHGGNLSIRMGDRVVIKRRGAMLGNLKPIDLVETGLEKNDRAGDEPGQQRTSQECKPFAESHRRPA